MDNEKFQELVLQQLQTLAENQKEMRTDVTRLDTRMENEFTRLDTRMENEFTRLETRMENEFTRLETRMENEFTRLETQITENQRGVRNDITRLETRMENEVIEKIRGLYDFREVQQDTNQNIISILGRIEAKIDVLQMETAHIRRVK
jgi:exonuclease VII large subunit